jgi:GTP cyclohydrolase I
VDPPSTTMESTLSDHSSSGEEGTTGAEEDVANAVRVLLRSIGEDPEREGLKNTPRRFAKAFAYFTKGYNEKPEDIVAGALFNENHQGMVVVKDIPVYSLCEHHLVPFFGKAHIGYIPDKHVVGLSKLARLVNVFSQRLQVQERLTNQIATSVHDLLQAKGVGVIIECTHMCMEMRGVKISGARTVTRSMLGLFSEEEAVRRDFEVSVGYSTCRAMEGSTSTASSSSCCVPDHNANLAVARIVSPSATKPQVETPIVPALAKTTTSGSCVQHTHARDFKLYLRCATQEYSRMVHVIKEAITAFGKSQNTGLSMLDIGAGNGHLLRALCAEGVRPSTYTAFEPDAELCSELQTTLRELDFNSNNTMVFQDVFGKTTQLPHAGGVADIVLMSHSLYGIKDKYSLVANALRFVAPEGVLLIFHHWTARGTISEISSSLFDDGLLHYTASYNVALDLTAGLTEDDLVRVSAYTKQDLLAGWKANTMSASRTLGYIAVEPHACRLGSDQEISLNIEAARTSVSYAARSKVPAAVIQPATGKTKEGGDEEYRHDTLSVPAQKLTSLCTLSLLRCKWLGYNHVSSQL